jgi:hypothetical protein
MPWMMRSDKPTRPAFALPNCPTTCSRRIGRIPSVRLQTTGGTRFGMIGSASPFAKHKRPAAKWPIPLDPLLVLARRAETATPLSAREPGPLTHDPEAAWFVMNSITTSYDARNCRPQVTLMPVFGQLLALARWVSPVGNFERRASDSSYSVSSQNVRAIVVGALLVCGSRRRLRWNVTLRKGVQLTGQGCRYRRHRRGECGGSHLIRARPAHSRKEVDPMRLLRQGWWSLTSDWGRRLFFAAALAMALSSVFVPGKNGDILIHFFLGIAGFGVLLSGRKAKERLRQKGWTESATPGLGKNHRPRWGPSHPAKANNHPSPR